VELWWGLLSWLAVGVTLALLARLLPPWRGTTLLATLVAGATGALAGGLLATALGFGGLAGFDPRSLATASLAAFVALLLLALAAGRQRP
jgi:uncharacterized membrane protein YeaQ/YmgE (transglycosylase-associated protein family)